MLSNFGFRCDIHSIYKSWIECYKETLTPKQRKVFKYTSSRNNFKFGSGEIQKSMYKATIAATIGDEDIFLETDVNINIPMLLSIASMNKVET